MVYQGDIQNSVDRIVNWEFDAELEQSVPFLAVNGTNKGVNMTLKINRDAFAEGSDQLVNFKKYYYTVIAYGYNNYARYDIVTDTGQQKPYLPGRNNVKTYTGIPHKSEPTFDGLVLNSVYGDQPEVRRMEGIGNGGNIIEIDSMDVLTILENGFMPTPLYKKNAAPINLKVIDPTAAVATWADIVVGLNSSPVNANYVGNTVQPWVALTCVNGANTDLALAAGNALSCADVSSDARRVLHQALTALGKHPDPVVQEQVAWSLARF
jgi:hypothetical protein